MSKRTIPQPDAPNNGQPTPEDVATFGPTDDVGDFNPADFEQPTTPPAPDPFDPAALRLNSDYSAAIGVRKVLLSVPVRKPGKSDFVRVHPDPAYRLETAVIELKEEGGETYLVAPTLWPELAGEATFSPRALFTAITRQGALFLWPCRLPRPDGRRDEWARTALEAVGLGMKTWVRMVADMSLGAYQVFQARGQLPDPEWPDTSFADLLRIAFRDKLIDSPNHPVLRRLRGEV